MRELTKNEIELVAGGATAGTLLQTAATGAVAGAAGGVQPAPTTTVRQYTHLQIKLTETGGPY